MRERKKGADRAAILERHPVRPFVRGGGGGGGDLPDASAGRRADRVSTRNDVKSIDEEEVGAGPYLDAFAFGPPVGAGKLPSGHRYALYESGTTSSFES